MRERVEYGEAGRQEFEQGAGRRPGAGGDAGGTAGGPLRGPRPVRPAGAWVTVRPLEAPAAGVRRRSPDPAPVPGPAWGDAARRAASGPRLLVRGAAGYAAGPGRARGSGGWSPVSRS